MKHAMPNRSFPKQANRPQVPLRHAAAAPNEPKAKAGSDRQ